MVWTIHLQDGDIFRRIVDCIKDLVPDTNIAVNSDGLSMQAMDSSHVSLVALDLQSRGFTSFNCDRPDSIGVNFAALTKILKFVGAGDSLTLAHANDIDNLELLVESSTQTRMLAFHLRLIEIDVEQLGIPHVDYKAFIRMKSDYFKSLIHKLKSLADTVQIHVTNKAVKFSLNGDAGTTDLVLKQADGDESNEQIDIKCSEDLKLTFALRYLESFSKASTLSEFVTLKLAINMPLAVEYRILDSNNNDFGHLQYYLAPKIEDETDASPDTTTNDGGTAKQTKQTSANATASVTACAPANVAPPNAKVNPPAAPAAKPVAKPSASKPKIAVKAEPELQDSD